MKRHRGKHQLIRNTELGENVKIWHFVNIYDSVIGDNTSVGSYTEIGEADIGANCSIQAFCYICPLTVIDDNVFLGPRVTFTNDLFPPSEKLQGPMVKKGAVIGAGAIILPGITIGENSLVGAGSIVTQDVEPNTTVVGNPAKHLPKYLRRR